MLLKVIVSIRVCIRSLLPVDVGIADELGIAGIDKEELWPLSIGCLPVAPDGWDVLLTMFCGV